MRRILCPKLPKPDQPVPLSKEEAKHLTRVLRMSSGDRVEAMNGQGRSVIARLVVEGTWVWLHHESELDPKTAQERDAHLPLTLSLSVLKADSMQWIIEKAVELGVERFRPILSERCVPQIADKGPEHFLERWERIAEQALKQCGRLHRMEIEHPISLDVLASQENNASNSVRLWCDEASPHEPESSIEAALQGAPQESEVELLIGPEGGWSENDRAQILGAARKWKNISLGPWILRSETAALVATALAASEMRRRKK